ncbi:hypothetical protein ACLOJK_017073 [Asimina triloba]
MQNMERERSEEREEISLDFKCERILSSVEKSSASDPAFIQNIFMDEKLEIESNIASPTPEKTMQPPRSKNKGNALPMRVVRRISGVLQDADASTCVADENAGEKDEEDASISESSHKTIQDLQKSEEKKLPDKWVTQGQLLLYEMIADFFDRMESSTRLLGLRKKLTSFENICAQVEVMTKRKFLHSHVAQLKYLFPEAIQIEKILTHDERTLCMKPDMKITLVADALEGQLGQSTTSLGKAFRQRLLEFIKSHPEGGDIPEAILPEPFSPRDNTLLVPLPMGSSEKLHQPTSIDSECLTNPSHFPTNFYRLLSQKIIPETEKTPLLACPIPVISETTNKENLHCETHVKMEVSSVSAPDNAKYPLKVISLPGHSGSLFARSTPSKPGSAPKKLMTETPPLSTPKRSMQTPDDYSSREAAVSGHSARRRALIFSSPTEFETNDSDTRSIMTEENRLINNFGVETATTGRIQVEEKSTSLLQEMVKENLGGLAKDCKMSKTGSAKRQEMLSCLPGLFNTICMILSSSHCLSITKQELIHKILWHDYDVTDSGEIEEQLKLLEELVPDWICGKMETSGDLLYCIRKPSDPDAVLSRLVEAA